MNDKDSVMDGVPAARVARRRRVTVVVGRVRMRARPGRLLGCLAGAVLAAGLAAGPAVARTSHARPVRESPVTEVSRGCFGDNADRADWSCLPVLRLVRETLAEV